MINRVVLVGRLTKDPELSYTSSGLAISRFTLAVNRTFSNQQGEREADFIGCVCFKKQAENVANYLKKGSLAGVDGRIQTGSYEKDGRRVYTTDVIADNVQFLEPKNSSAESRGNSFTPPAQGYGGQSQGQAQQNSFGGAPSNTGFQKGNDDPFANAGKTIDISDDDLPF